MGAIMKNRTVEEIKNKEPMRYWSLSPKASENQKNKLKRLVRESKDYYAVLKRDGAWYKFVKGEDGEPSLLQSRTVSKVTGDYVEKQDNVPHIVESLEEILPNNTIVLGEICYMDKSRTSSDIVKIMGALPKKAIARQEKEKLHYYIFDILVYEGVEAHAMSAENRLKLLKKIEKQLTKKYEYIHFVEPVFDNIEEQLAKWLEEGYEGGVLMRKKDPYHFGKKPAWSTIKFKQSLEDNIDLVIMGVTPPRKEYTGKYPATHIYWERIRTGELVEGIYYGQAGYTPVTSHYFEGLIGGFQLGAYYNDKLIEVGKVSNLTDEVRYEATREESKYIGMVVEVQAMQIDYEKRSLRHAKLVNFRPDKPAKDCLYQDIF